MMRRPHTQCAAFIAVILAANFLIAQKVRDNHAAVVGAFMLRRLKTDSLSLFAKGSNT